MDYENRKHYEYFTGLEVERSTQHLERTLFVVGVKPVPEVVALAKKKQINHIFLGAHQSFNPNSIGEWDLWDEMVTGLLEGNFVVTVDFDVSLLHNIHERKWCDYHNFSPMISVKIPNIDKLNYRAVLKIDVPIDDLNNAGVWCHRVQALTTPETFTGWNEYNNDSEITNEDANGN